MSSARLAGEGLPVLPAHEVHSKMKLVEPRAHRLPWHVMWTITLVTAVGMAVLNFFTIVCMRRLVGWKFHLMQHVTDTYGVFWGTFMLVACSATTATMCTCLIFKVSPDAGGSGAPENRGWLNGSSSCPTGGYTLQHLIVRGLATILGNASGYPVGREGPTVSMGSNFAFLVTDYLAASHVRHWVDIENTATMMVDEERLAHAKRVACAVGGACGMAMIFDSPIGGILYMLEEVTAICWPLELTFRAFVGTIICALLSRAFLYAMGTDIKAFVIYEWSPQQHVWDWWDVPSFVVLSAIMGIFSAYHSRVCLQVGVLRQTAMKALEGIKPAHRMIEAVLYACMCALVSALVAQMGRCEPLHAGASVEFVRYNCKEGEYNPVASLLVTTSEAAVNLLFSRKNAGSIHPINAGLAFLAYTCLNMGLTGVPVPSGNFTGTMLIGGLVGRMVGSTSESLGLTGPAVSGVYAMIGSAAMLCGFKRMSMAVVVFVATAANDFNLVPPLMLSVVVSLILSKQILPSGYDEEQVLRRNVAFLEPEPPVGMDSMLAKDLFDKLPDCARLPPEAKASAVAKALEIKGMGDFPVIRPGGVCIGFTTRERLEVALQACVHAGTRASHARQGEETPGGGVIHPVEGAQSPAVVVSGQPQHEENLFDRLISETITSAFGELPRGAMLPVSRLVDPVPYTILEDMPAPRFYTLFAKAGINTASVVSPNGEFRGMISRSGLIAATLRLDHD